MTYHRYVLHHRVPDYLLLGWMAFPTLDGTHHGFWSVHCAWLCDCKPVEPPSHSHMDAVVQSDGGK